MIIRKWFTAFLSLFASVSSLANAQKANRLALADHLEQNVTDAEYYHGKFSTCALGHAGNAGIGGLTKVRSFPILASRNMDVNADAGTLRMCSEQDSETVFGKGAWDSIFDDPSFSDSRTRLQSVERLRNFEPIAA